MKLKAIALALFVAGASASYAVAGDGHGQGKDKTGSTTTVVSTSAETTTNAATPKKVTLCHKAGKSGKWVKITIGRSAARAHLRHGDQAPDASGNCPAPAPKGTDKGTTTTTSQ